MTMYNAKSPHGKQPQPPDNMQYVIRDPAVKCFPHPKAAKSSYHLTRPFKPVLKIIVLRIDVKRGKNDTGYTFLLTKAEFI